MKTPTIRKKLAALRSRLRLLLALGGLLRVVGVAAAAVAISFALDFLFQLPQGARAVVLVLGLAAVGWTVARHLVMPWRVSLDDEALAVAVESRHPELALELVSALQLERRLAEGRDEGESPEMMNAAVAAAETRLAGLDIDDTVTARPLARPAFLSVAGVLLIALYAASLPAHASLWLDRCLLLRDRPWPPRTELEVTITNIGRFRHEIGADGATDLYVPENATIRVEVRARGEVPPTVTIRKFDMPRDESPDAVAIEMGASAAEEALFEYKFGRVSGSFEFFVEGGDDLDEAPYFRVHVRTAPRVDAFSVDYDYPDYVNEAGREDRLGVREYNVVAPAGTRATLRFRASAPVDRFEIILDDDAENPLVLDPRDEAQRDFVWETTLVRDGFYSYRMIGANGAPSREAPNFNLGAQTDLPPTIGLVLPDSSSIDATAVATVPLQFVVGDDLRVGEIALRWDLSREGAFANRIELEPDDVRIEDDGREHAVFRALDLRRFRVAEADAVRELVAGDVVYLRIEARDTRRTGVDPEPNESVYPTLIALNVREAGDIERELVRGQVRTKEQVERAAEAVALRERELAAMLDEVAAGVVGPERLDPVHALLAGQSLVTSSLSEASRGFVRTFDGFLFNRMDPSNLTETLIVSICERHRRGNGTHYEHVAASLPELRGRIDESEAMGKLASVMDLLVRSADQLSPAVGEKLKAALDAREADALAARAREALEAQMRLRETLAALVEKMEEWEDFQDVIQSLKDILELQRGLAERVEKIAR